MSKRRSRVHPNYKTRYRVRNWHDYDRALRCRGDITIWLTPAAIAAWTPLGTRARGGQRRYSDTVIETALTLRMVFGLAWRQTEGLLHSILSLMGLELEVPDHTTLSRRTVGLEVELTRRAPQGPITIGPCGAEATSLSGSHQRRSRRGRRWAQVLVEASGGTPRQ